MLAEAVGADLRKGADAHLPFLSKHTPGHHLALPERNTDSGVAAFQVMEICFSFQPRRISSAGFSFFFMSSTPVLKVRGSTKRLGIV